MRKGYCPTTVKTTAGPITLARPKLRGATERFASRLFGKGVTKTHALESLVIAGFVRGLSTRDVEAALTEALGQSATVSKSAVSRVCGDIKAQFDSWSQRRLDDVRLDYLFLDGSHFKYHANASAEPVLAAWGNDTRWQAGVYRTGCGGRRVRRRLGGLLDRSRRARAVLPPAGGQ
jgi:transposase-like protein